MNAQSARRNLTPVEQPQPQRVSILDTVAARYGMDPVGFQRTLRQTVFKDASNEEFAALLVVANEHGLNPLTKEIYAFKAQGGGIVPLVSIDGWIRIMNSHPQFDGIEYQDIPDDQGSLLAIECTIYRKDRSHPIKVIEYLSECKRNTNPWKEMPARMLRHKATIQCARYAFGFSGIYSEDDVEFLAHGGRIQEIEMVPPMRSAKAGDKKASAKEPEPKQEHIDDETGEVLSEETDEHPARAIADHILLDLGDIKNFPDFNSLKSRVKDDVAAMPDDIAGEVNAAFNEFEAGLKAGKQQ